MRVVDGNGDGIIRVDMGADEYCWSPADFNNGGNVDLFDYTIFLAAWASNDSNTNYNEKCDLWDDNTINYQDLRLFCEEEWLGKRCRYENLMMYMAAGGDGLLGGEGMEFSQESFSLEGDETSFELEPSPSPEIDPNVIKEMLEWLDEMWQSGVFKDVMTEEEYLEFRKLVLESGNY
jgi:hypothetical protein